MSKEKTIKELKMIDHELYGIRVDDMDMGNSELPIETKMRLSAMNHAKRLELIDKVERLILPYHEDKEIMVLGLTAIQR